MTEGEAPHPVPPPSLSPERRGGARGRGPKTEDRGQSTDSHRHAAIALPGGEGGVRFGKFFFIVCDGRAPRYQCTVEAWLSRLLYRKMRGHRGPGRSRQTHDRRISGTPPMLVEKGHPEGVGSLRLQLAGQELVVVECTSHDVNPFACTLPLLHGQANGLTSWDVHSTTT